MHPPEGAFYLFIDFSPFSEALARKGIADSSALCESLLAETGVAILPGASFQRPPEELTARLAYVNFDGSKALATSETIALSEELPDDFGDYCCVSVFEAMHRIVDWLKG